MPRRKRDESDGGGDGKKTRRAHAAFLRAGVESGSARGRSAEEGDVVDPKVEVSLRLKSQREKSSLVDPGRNGHAPAVLSHHREGDLEDLPVGRHVEVRAEVVAAAIRIG